MKIPLKYSLRSLWTRRLTTTLTMVGIALVVFVFAAVLMMAHGLQHTLVSTGSDENVLILRKAANAEISSIISHEQANIVTSLSQVARTSDGKALASGEVVVIINLRYISANGYANVTVRGVSPQAFQLRPQVRLVSGRLFRFGSREVIVGSSIARRFQGAGLGERIKFGGDMWEIVGVFDTDGSGFDSEIWGDADQLGQAFERPVYSTVTVQLARPDQYQELLKAFESDRRLQTLEPKREKQFYEEQSEVMAKFIRILGDRDHRDIQHWRGHRRHDHDVRSGLQQDGGDRHASFARVQAAQRAGRVSCRVVSSLDVWRDRGASARLHPAVLLGLHDQFRLVLRGCVQLCPIARHCGVLPHLLADHGPCGRVPAGSTGIAAEYPERPESS